ncbi:MAG: sigma-70 family RNA polymerase sigma factor, partial [Chloroflexi bacterium]|nr:sigma-70 family RNA polymerase sigma factor [Chloroflexota bacterium]
PGETDAGLGRLGPDATVVGGAVPDPLPEDAAEASAVREAITAALASMPEAERTVIELAYREGLTQQEIAERLAWPLGTVKTRTRRALGRLRELLEADLAPVGAGAEIREVDLGSR